MDGALFRSIRMAAPKRRSGKRHPPAPTGLSPTRKERLAAPGRPMLLPGKLPIFAVNALLSAHQEGCLRSARSVLVEFY